MMTICIYFHNLVAWEEKMLRTSFCLWKVAISSDEKEKLQRRIIACTEKL